MTDDKPLRIALEQTLTGLKTQFPTFDQEYSQGLEGEDTRYEHLHWMIDSCLENLYEWPADKISRWIGYVQGILTHRGDIDTDKERDRTRPFFHEAYTAMGWKKPETIDRREPLEHKESDAHEAGHQYLDDFFFQSDGSSQK